MTAVAKLAPLRKNADIFKRLSGAFLMFQELKFSHSRGVNQYAFAGKKDHLAGRGSVLPPVIVCAHRLHAKRCVGEPVDDVDLPTPDEPTNAAVVPAAR